MFPHTDIDQSIPPLRVDPVRGWNYQTAKSHSSKKRRPLADFQRPACSEERPHRAEGQPGSSADLVGRRVGVRPQEEHFRHHVHHHQRPHDKKKFETPGKRQQRESQSKQTKDQRVADGIFLEKGQGPQAHGLIRTVRNAGQPEQERAQRQVKHKAVNSQHSGQKLHALRVSSYPSRMRPVGLPTPPFCSLYRVPD
jgi:hypothetical protein